MPERSIISTGEFLKDGAVERVMPTYPLDN